MHFVISKLLLTFAPENQISTKKEMDDYHAENMKQ